MSFKNTPRADVCIIVPCHNEAAAIARIVRACREHVATVFVVDDASTDATAAEAAAAGAVVVRHPRNLGKGVALKSGFAAAAKQSFAAAITLDGDGQHDCSEVPLFLQAYDAGECDIVVGNRMNDTRTMPLVRRIANRTMSRIISRMVRNQIADTQCGFRLIALDFWTAVRLDSSHFDLESEILIKACRRGARLRQVPIRTIYFGTEKSKINPFTDALRFVHLLWRCRNA